MPDDRFPKRSGEKGKSTEEAFERLLEVNIDPAVTTVELMSHFNQGLNIRFIVNDNFNIFLGLSEHFIIQHSVGVKTNDCFLDDGVFRLDQSSRKVIFLYTSPKNSPIQTDKIIKKAAENKITSFLKTNGIEIK